MGLPVSRLQPLVRRQVTGDADGGGESVELDAVNRRGRPVRVRVTATAFSETPGQRAGAVVLMDPIA